MDRAEVVKRIDERVKIVVAAVDEVSQLMGHDESPLTGLQIALYRDRCRTMNRDLEYFADVTAKAAREPTRGKGGIRA